MLTNLKVEGAENPVGISPAAPRFSWQMQSTVAGQKQTSYRILVAETEEALQQGALLWDSGTVFAAESVGIVYKGQALNYGTAYVWQVEVADKDGRRITSPIATFETAETMDGAKWISFPDTQTNNYSHYKIDADISVKSKAATLMFGDKGTGYYFAWQYNIEKTDASGNPTLYLRPHAFGYVAWPPVVAEIDVSSFLENNNAQTRFHTTIDVNGKVITTYINGELVYTYTSPETVVYSRFGHRHADGEAAEYQNYIVTGYLADGSEDTPVLVTAQTTANSTGEVWLSDGQADGGVSPILRKEFTAEKEVAKARLYASALGVYDVYINGTRIGDEELKPGWTEYRSSILYQTYDATEAVKQGDNAIGVYLGTGWFSGRIAQNRHNGYEKEFFIAKLVITYTDGSTQTLVTDDSWKASKKDSPIRRSDIYDGATYDGRLGIGFTGVGYDDSKWSRAQADDHVENMGSLKITPIGTLPKVAAVYDPVQTISQADGSVIYDFDNNLAGWVKLRVKGEQGASVTIRHAELLLDGKMNYATLRTAQNTDTYILNGNAEGEIFAPSLIYHGFRYAEITCSGEVEILQVQAVEITSATEITGTFKTSNERFNTLYDYIYQSQKGNMISLPTDCPQRDERNGWMADAQIFATTGMYNANVLNFFETYCMDMRDSQSPSGMYSDVAPAAAYQWEGLTVATGWADAGITIPYYVYKMYGDIGILEQNYSAMKKYMDLFSPTAPTQGWQYNEWQALEQTPEKYMNTVYSAFDAMLMEEMAKALHNSPNSSFYGTLEQDIARYQALYQQIKEQFNREYVDLSGEKIVDAGTQTEYAWALLADLLPDAQTREKVVSLLEKNIRDRGVHFSVGYLGINILHPVLSQVGLSDLSYELMLQESMPSVLHMVNQDTKTLWETWDVYNKAENRVHEFSVNHVAYAAVGEWFYRYMLGIEADFTRPGFQHVQLAPQPYHGIDWAEGSYQSAYGLIESRWSAVPGGYRYDFCLPANTSADLTLQVEDGQRIYMPVGAAYQDVTDSFALADGTATKAIVSGDHTFVVSAAMPEGTYGVKTVEKTAEKITVTLTLPAVPDPDAVVLVAGYTNDNRLAGVKIKAAQGIVEITEPWVQTATEAKAFIWRFPKTVQPLGQ